MRTIRDDFRAFQFYRWRCWRPDLMRLLLQIAELSSGLFSEMSCYVTAALDNKLIKYNTRVMGVNTYLHLKWCEFGLLTYRND